MFFWFLVKWLFSNPLKGLTSRVMDCSLLSNFVINGVNHCLGSFSSFVFSDLIEEDFKPFIVFFPMFSLQVVLAENQGGGGGYRPVRNQCRRFWITLSLCIWFQCELALVSSGKLIGVRHFGCYFLIFVNFFIKINGWFFPFFQYKYV